MTARRHSKTLYLRVTAQRHAAIGALAASRGETITEVLDHQVTRLLRGAASTSVVADLDARLRAVEASVLSTS